VSLLIATINDLYINKKDILFLKKIKQFSHFCFLESLTKRILTKGAYNIANKKFINKNLTYSTSCLVS